MGTLIVKDIIESTLATTRDKGEKFFPYLKEQVDCYENVYIDFTGIKRIIPSFVNTGIAPLLEYMTREELERKLIYLPYDISSVFLTVISDSFDNTLKAINEGITTDIEKDNH